MASAQDQPNVKVKVKPLASTELVNEINWIVLIAVELPDRGLSIGNWTRN